MLILVLIIHPAAAALCTNNQFILLCGSLVLLVPHSFVWVVQQQCEDVTRSVSYYALFALTQACNMLHSLELA